MQLTLLGLFQFPIFDHMICIRMFLLHVLRYFIYLIFLHLFLSFSFTFALSVNIFSFDNIFSGSGKSFVFEFHTHLLQADVIFAEFQSSLGSWVPVWRVGR